jgi:uncharacterized iron-regulated membrane protein
MSESIVTIDATESPESTETEAKPARKIRGLFAAFWRWHFFAAILVIPAFLVLSLTGLALLYKAQIDPLFHPGVLVVDAPAGANRLLLSQQMAGVTHEFPDRAVVSIADGAGGTATIFGTVTTEGDLRNVYVNPFTAQVTGDVDPSELPSSFATEWHRGFTAGDAGRYAMELAACWSIVMAITGYYLFFKGRKARGRRLKGKANGAKVTSVHAWVGAVAGIGILALIFSGLPWTILWGTTVQSLTAESGGLWGDDPGAKSTIGDRIKAVDGDVATPGWAISQGTVPDSAPPVDPVTGVVSVDVAVAAAAAKGIPQPYFIAFPEGETGVYSVMGDQWHDNANPSFQDVSLEAAAHVDQYSGKVIATYGYWDYSAAAQVVSQGIAMHEGRRFGAFSSFISTMFCLGILFLCISSPIMWWRRRKGKSGLQAPAGKMPVYASWTLAAVLVVLGVVLPVFGISLVIVLLLDFLVIRRIPALKRAFNTVD